VGVEAPAALRRVLGDQGQVVLEVNRPDRQARRRRGKSDPVDAAAAARSRAGRRGHHPAQAGNATVEMLRSLRVARQTASTARTQAINALTALLVTAPAQLREQLRGRSAAMLVRQAAALEPGPLCHPTAAATLALRCLARRYQACTPRSPRSIPSWLGWSPRPPPGWSPGSASAPTRPARCSLAAGDNPGRRRSDAGFAMLCGSSPIQASSGKTRRHRRNRGGDRQANAALDRIVVVRLRWHQPTKDSMARRLTEARPPSRSFAA